MIKNQLSEFKKFVLRGNVVDLAVGVAIGAAFNSVVQALVTDLITPLINAFTGASTGPGSTFEKKSVIFNGHQLFIYGHFLNTLVTFLITAAVIFFIIVQPINRLTSLANKGKKTEDPSTKKCGECLSEIPKDARRCKFCAAQLIGEAPAGSGKSLAPANRQPGRI